MLFINPSNIFDKPTSEVAIEDRPTAQIRVPAAVAVATPLTPIVPVIPAATLVIFKQCNRCDKLNEVNNMYCWQCGLQLLT